MQPSFMPILPTISGIWCQSDDLGSSWILSGRAYRHARPQAPSCRIHAGRNTKITIMPTLCPARTGCRLARGAHEVPTCSSDAGKHLAAQLIAMFAKIFYDDEGLRAQGLRDHVPPFP
jgi:hypothetical protein